MSLGDEMILFTDGYEEVVRARNVEDALACDDLEWLRLMLEIGTIDEDDVVNAMDALGWTDQRAAMLKELGLCTE